MLISWSSRRLLTISPRRAKNTKSVAPFHCSTTFRPSWDLAAQRFRMQILTVRSKADLNSRSVSKANGTFATPPTVICLDHNDLLPSCSPKLLWQAAWGGFAEGKRIWRHWVHPIGGGA